MSHRLDLDLLRSSFAFLNRKQLLTLFEGTSHRIHSLIQSEFGNKPPYSKFERLCHSKDNWKYKVNDQSEFEVPSNQDEFYALLTNCKLIRSRDTRISSTNEISFDFLKSISHIWNGQELSLKCDQQFGLSHEFYRLISTSASYLDLTFPGALSVLSEPFIQEYNHYREIRLRYYTLYHPVGEFPYTNGIAEFLFASDANSRKLLRLFVMDLFDSPQTIQHRWQIADAIKQKFLSAAVVLNFVYRFEWHGCGRWEENDEVILNTQTNQRLLYRIDRRYYLLKTLSIDANP